MSLSADRPTPAEVRAEPPGPRLDAWYAEIVLGWWYDAGCKLWGRPAGPQNAAEYEDTIPPVSTDPALLGPELERLDGLGMPSTISIRQRAVGPSDFRCTIYVGNKWYGNGLDDWYATRNEAVVKAALLARLGGGVGMLYTRENGYGTIDTNAEQFQLGRRLYEAQVLFADLEAGKTVSPERVKELVQRYCELVNWVGLLRADYDVMRRVAEGKATFRER